MVAKNVLRSTDPPEIIRIDDEIYGIIKEAAPAACCAEIKNNVKTQLVQLLEGPRTLDEYQVLYNNIVFGASRIGAQLRADGLLDDDIVNALATTNDKIKDLLTNHLKWMRDGETKHYCTRQI